MAFMICVGYTHGYTPLTLAWNRKLAAVNTGPEWPHLLC